MRMAWRATLVVVLVPLATLDLAAQASPHALLPEDDEAFCGRLFLRYQGRTFGHEFVEFSPAPAVAGDPERVRGAEFAPLGRDRRPALWWRISPDSVGAYLAGEEDTVWELRLGTARTVLGGTLQRVLPPVGDMAEAFTMRTPCPDGSSSP